MNDPLVSIIMRSYNEAWALGATLQALQAQNYRNYELIVIDSGSTDGSQALIQAAKPAHFVQITPQEYNPSKVMNHGMRLAKSEICIFLNADSTPQGDQWLRPLVEALQEPQVAACFGRQNPRPDCEAVFACDYERCFGEDRESASWDHFFSMVSSGLRKDVWAQRGFREDLQYAEDDEYTRWCKAAGFEVRYIAQSVVMHSHNYTPEQSYRRALGDARALGKASREAVAAKSFFKSVVLGWVNDIRRDIAFCARNFAVKQFGHAMKIRWKQRCGAFAGFQQGCLEAH